MKREMLYLICIDASKAFDKVNRDLLYSKLILKAPAYVVRALINYYSESMSIVENDKEYSRIFTTSVGVKQGGPLSPRLFSLYIEDIIEIIEQTKIGIEIGNIKLDIILYADDMTLIANTKSGMQKLLKIVERFGLQMEVKFNGSKTQMIIFNKELKKSRWSLIHDKWQNKLKLNNEVIEEVKAIKYLGSMIEQKNNGNLHIKVRKKIAFISTTKLEHMGLNSDAIEPSKKGFMYKTYVRPKFTFGIDNFSLNATQIKKIQKIDGSMLKRLLNVNKYCYNTELFTSLNMLPTSDLYKKMKLNLFLRLCKNEIMYDLLEQTFMLVQAEVKRESVIKDILTILKLDRGENNEFDVLDIEELANLVTCKLHEIEANHKAEYENNPLVTELKRVINKEVGANRLIDEILIPPSLKNASNEQTSL